MAECSITDSDGLSLLKLRPLFKIVPYFCSDHDLIMQGFVFCFFLLAGISHCLSFSFLLYLHLLYLRFFILSLLFMPPALLSLSRFFCFLFFAFCPLKTLSVFEAGCFLCMSAPLRSSGFPFTAFQGWGLLRKDTWKLNWKYLYFILTLRADFWFKIIFLKNLEDFRAFCLADEKFDSRSLADFLLLFSHQVVSDPLQPHGLQHTGLPCPLVSPGVCPNSCPCFDYAIQLFHPLLFPSPALNLS